MKWLDNIPLYILIFGALLLGTAPIKPEPHLVEKIRMLLQGTLHRPIDIFDLFMHGILPLLVIVKLARMGLSRNRD
jgi:hypothetical protein